MKASPSTIALILLPLTLLLLILLLLYPNDYRLQTLTLSAACRHSSSSSSSFTGLITPKPDFRLLIGILTLPDLYERRHLLRLVYSLQPLPPSVAIDIRFVFCNLTSDDQTTLVSLEIMRFDDVIILNCTENMNDGKTYSFFSSLPSLLNSSSQPYDYVMKADDDIYFRLPQLADSIRGKPREDMYYGFVIPCGSMDPFHDYMSGMGYVLSWDLVAWIGTSDWVRNRTVGAEDLVTGS